MTDHTAMHPLRRQRLRAGMLQVKLAELSGRSQACISRVETWALSPSQDFYVAAAKALSCSVDDLRPSPADQDAGGGDDE